MIKRTTKKNIRINNNFDIQSITQKVYEELFSTEKYHIIDNSFVYFPEFFIGEGCYRSVMFGIKLNDFFPLLLKFKSIIMEKITYIYKIKYCRNFNLDIKPIYNIRLDILESF